MQKLILLFIGSFFFIASCADNRENNLMTKHASIINEEFIYEIENALSTSWTKPFYVLEPKYPITGVAQLQEAWA